MHLAHAVLESFEHIHTVAREFCDPQLVNHICTNSVSISNLFILMRIKWEETFQWIEMEDFIDRKEFVTMVTEIFFKF